MSTRTEGGKTMTTQQFSRRGVALTAAGALALAGLVATPTVAAARAGTTAPVAAVTAIAPAAVLAPSEGTTCVAGALNTRRCELFARTGVNAGPGVLTGVTFWSYTSGAADPVGTTGPTLVVRQGETVTLGLHNRLGAGINTSLAAPQVDGFVDDPTGVANDDNKDYTFVAGRAGTYLYEAGGTADGARQTALGMVGALVVLPAAGAGTAYGVSYTDESVVLLTDVDPALHLDPSGYDLRLFNPKFHLLNGATYPTTASIPATAGGTELLRVVNGGAVQHALGVLGTTQRVIGASSRQLSHPYGVAAENIPAGDTLDLLVSVPTSSTPGLKYAVYDASTRLDSSTGTATGMVPFGGALTFLDTGASTPAPAGPTITGLAVTPQRSNGAAAMSFTATAGISGDPAVTGLEYVIDNGSIAPGTGTAVPGATGPLTRSFSISAGLTSGTHTLLVRASSASGWGPLAAATFVIDKVGPSVTALTLSPSVVGTSGVSVPVTIGGSATDATAGGSDVTGVTYSIDGGASTPLTLAPVSGVSVSVSGVIAKSVVDLLSEGKHSISAVATDALGKVGPATTTTLVVDRTAPTVSNLSVSPNPNSGSQGTPADPTSVEVRASYGDLVSGIAAGGPAASGVVSGEAFVGGTAAGTAGTGFILTPYPTGAPTQLLGTFPVTELTRFTGTTANVLIWVRAKDAAGNWGVAQSVTLVITRDGIFSSNFETPTTLAPPWTSQVASNSLTVANASTTATRQLVVTRSGTGNFSVNSRGYVATTAPSAETSFKAAFDFTPGTLTTGSSAANARILTIFAARTGANANALTVQYRSYLNTREVRMVVTAANGTRSTAWTPLTTGNGQVTLHLTWQSAVAGNATFTIGTTALPTLTGLNTSASTIETAWLGVSGSSGSGTVSTGSLAFDNFISRRTTAP